jgi:hypothetical protein
MRLSWLFALALTLAAGVSPVNAAGALQTFAGVRFGTKLPALMAQPGSRPAARDNRSDVVERDVTLYGARLRAAYKLTDQQGVYWITVTRPGWERRAPDDCAREWRAIKAGLETDYGPATGDESAAIMAADLSIKPAGGGDLQLFVDGCKLDIQAHGPPPSDDMK